MDNFFMPSTGLHYAYQFSGLPGRFQQAVISTGLHERVLFAERYLANFMHNPKLIVVDGLRSTTLQAALFLQAFGAVRANALNPVEGYLKANALAPNPVDSRPSEHVLGRAVDLLMADPFTGKPFWFDLKRYDAWQSLMEPNACFELSFKHVGSDIGAAYFYADSREKHVRAACVSAGFVASGDEFCHFVDPTATVAELSAQDLNPLYSAPVSKDLSNDLIGRCFDLKQRYCQ